MPEPILTLESVGLKNGAGWLFDGLSLTIDARDRLALIGRNGAGKSTLQKIIDGTIEADAGRRATASGLRIGRLEQDPPMAAFATLGDYALAGGAADHEVAALADQLGIDLARPATTASGGERRRAALVRVLAEAPDLLLLDEPTNHLDIAAIEWLESWLERSRCALVVISHDRAFLTSLTKNCLWLDRGTLRRAEVGFGGFDAWADAVAAEEERTAQRLDTKLRAEEHWLQRGVTARRKRNMGRLAKLMELRETRRSLDRGPTSARITTESSDPGSKILIDARGISLAFGPRAIVHDLSLRVRKGDRIGIIGPNGAGKSTLIKLLLGKLAPDSGEIRRSANLAPTIIDQHRQRLKGRTVREVLADGGEWLEVNGAKKHVAGYLKEYLFDAGILDAAAETLSGGEQSRLLLAREFATPSTLMVLDEPTNDLDMETLDLIEEVIGDYDGTVLLVSHDRAFLDRVVTMIVALDGNGKAEISVGGWSDWAARQQAATSAPKPKATPTPTPAPKKASKLSYKDARELADLPTRIEALNKDIATREAALADPDLYTKNPARFASLTAELDRLRETLETAELRWLELAELEEQLAG
ncbi:elongation factor 3 [Sandarakinorhabdus cyanobacteriorum]|uniref:Elongation factor 3 n=1 Tax=Sandarakinorhabdus cyanobacteriorum TaxID=1981098 RepID=A0A255YXX3_9SPHN|nr:ATP-binding cassette domain-containing protein [Sandarakinorhabdus cyanobacteriorum]OYQ34052.1 elongation factor 3 [Sandarakinorhabdus cyanobacteriorum]